MLRGQRIPFMGKPIITAGGEDRFVKLLPVVEEVANGRMSLLGAWLTRPGYEVVLNLDSDADVTMLAEHNGLVAATSDGEVFRSTGEDFKAATALSGRLTGHSRPVSVVHDGALIIADGGPVMVAEGSRLRRVGIPSISPGAPTVTAIGLRGEVTEGSYVYAVTATTVAGESLLGAESAVVALPVGRNTVRVEAPDFSEDDLRFVLTWSVYRRKAAGIAWGLVGGAAADVKFIEDATETPNGDPPVTDGSSSYPPEATDVVVVGDYLLYFGYDSTAFSWSNPGNHDYNPPANTTTVQLDGGFIQTAVGNGKDLLIFRTTMLDWYALVGGGDVFVRRQPIRRGCLARKSVVVVDGTMPYWLGDDGIFYRLKGVTPDPIGVLEQDFVWSLRSPESIYGEHFPRERVIRWFSDVDGVCIGFNYAKDHFFRDFSWDGRKRTQLGLKSTVHHNGTVFVGLSGGRVGTWGDEHTTDAGGRIRTIRRFTVPLDDRGRNARANALTFRHERGTHDTGNFWQGLLLWNFNTEYFVGDQRVSGLDPVYGTPVPYICHTAYTSGGMTVQQPGNASGQWEANWRRLRADDLLEITVRWGFDQGSQQGEQRIPMGVLGDTQPYAVIGPCGMGREMWIELERAASVPVSFTGGAVVAQPLGDGVA